jgi:hypothetical protein
MSSLSDSISLLSVHLSRIARSQLKRRHRTARHARQKSAVAPWAFVLAKHVSRNTRWFAIQIRKPVQLRSLTPNASSSPKQTTKAEAGLQSRRVFSRQKTYMDVLTLEQALDAAIKIAMRIAACAPLGIKATLA